ncbi:Endonuclease Nob1 consisting of PIN domain and Zn-ribbon module [Methanonatronarchaeum thermophilum]|uniref:Endonuclease Nob1 consisting of PIN domain and Zn-ribbon module n=1 Tax=Methanonatronarchaeum thermophilum TaxID=1927129 RepID=A0A1Y3GG13_9EURY|nr:hypothetical protein [Methanonatronarchaeum thermophilum]OUJ18395.1 Endonuclease Nob1 consisting of PIN domain and Zn-ribbon module [Methanonatronarchaeum thermophilum]
MAGVFVVDTSVFIVGKQPEGEVVTVQEVVDEVKDKVSRYNLGRGYSVSDVLDEDITHVKDVCIETGDYGRVSKTDLKLLALAYRLKLENKSPVVVSDDYSIQNVLEKLNIPYQGVQQEEIEKEVVWGFRCVGCKREFSSKELEDCPVCGSGLEERILKRKDIVDD